MAVLASSGSRRHALAKQVNMAKTAECLRDCMRDGNIALIWQIQYALVNPAV